MEKKEESILKKKGYMTGKEFKEAVKKSSYLKKILNKLDKAVDKEFKEDA
ncbi:MAG TPA: hypothetical protein PK079_21135 [Leptospiraceae bacterium]|nr:hypothetical protein [Leptospiraceae bacterium]HMX33790.1 hypothetical protein [Leptospiraceae bacterium]HMY32813.1 hypothetical protein [Leptospiraceae bacterium]HMZ67530.1 hypothetical protein [Leptospiraceae bacterium]HNA08152.1 hypothetical protein [Leptospiraceae bacterium]